MKVLQKAEDLVKRLQGGEDFAKLAKEHSQDAQTAAKGGSLGWKKQGELPEALDKALFEEMAPGQLTERPIKSPEGFHILRLEELRSERIKPLDEVRETLERELRQDKSRGRASELAEEAYRAIFTGGDFREVAKRFEVSPEQTQAFPLSGSRKDLPMGDAFRKAAFSLKQKGDFSEVVEDGGVFYVLDLLDRWPSREPQFDEVQDRVREDVKRLKAAERAAQEAQAFLQRVREGKVALSDGAAQAGWKVQTSPSLNRISPLPGLPPEMIQDAFSLPKDTTLLPEPYSQGDRILVAEIKERLPADPKGLEEQRALYRSILLRDQRESQYREWLEMLRARAEIRMHRGYQDVL
jgi:peptidyl-prolyl cis-trans isomerase D